MIINLFGIIFVGKRSTLGFISDALNNLEIHRICQKKFLLLILKFIYNLRI